MADLVDRWWNNYSGHGVGLRGGTWSYTGDRTTVFHLHGVRLTRDLAVSGTATWERYANRMSVDLTVAGTAGTAICTGTGTPGARGASPLHGSFGGHPADRDLPRRREEARYAAASPPSPWSTPAAGCCSRSATSTRRSTPTRGRWSAAASRTGESRRRGAVRELEEETGLTGVDLEPLETFALYCDGATRPTSRAVHSRSPS